MTSKTMMSILIGMLLALTGLFAINAKAETCFEWTENPSGPEYAVTEYYQLYMNGNKVGVKIPYGTTATCDQTPTDGKIYTYHLTAGGGSSESGPSDTAVVAVPVSIQGFKITVTIEPIN